MSYINANIILPEDLVKEIQNYVNGVNLYIPKVPVVKNTFNSYQLEIYKRNQEIYKKFLQGAKVPDLAGKYYLSDKSIYRILGSMKKQEYKTGNPY